MNFIKYWLAKQIVSRNKNISHPVQFLEQKHVDNKLEFANDSSFFYGGDEKGNAFIARIAFRGKNRKPEAWFDFFLKEMGFVGLKNLTGEEKEGFQLGGLKWEATEVGRNWRITYEGVLEDRNGNIFQSEVNLEFFGEHPVFEFAKSSDKKTIARAIASQKWNKEIFGKLKDLSQVHYEQTGRLNGYVELNGVKTKLEMVGLRDHSFGSRTWYGWDRHYWMSGVNKAGWAFTVTTIRYDFIDRLTAGFVTDPDGNADAITECTGLEEISRNGIWPEKGIVEIITRNERMYSLIFHRKGHFPYLMDNTYVMLEGIGEYNFNNSPALGMIEFGFNKEKYSI